MFKPFYCVLSISYCTSTSIEGGQKGRERLRGIRLTLRELPWIAPGAQLVIVGVDETRVIVSA